MNSDFVSVTELSGDEVSAEQITRLKHRYAWAGQYCQDKSALEVACGTGQGLGHLSRMASDLVAGDYSSEILSIALKHYRDRMGLIQFDAGHMPFADQARQVVIISEALYYLPDINNFLAECNRVLSDDGMVLIVTANKDLYDFNPSPFSNEYLGVVELHERLSSFGFSVECFGYMNVGEVGWRQKLLRPAKKLAVSLGLMPKSMASKKLLKRLMFGGLKQMPAEVSIDQGAVTDLVELPATLPDREHKVIYCIARKQ